MYDSGARQQNPWGGWVGISVLALSIFAFVAAAWRIDYPGLYYDEALFIPPSAWLFDDCTLAAGVYARIGCLPVIIQPPYLGGLKSIIFAPIFAMFDVTMASIRLPAILLLIATNLIAWSFWRHRLGVVGSMALLLLLSTDFVSLFHAKVDWGPFVIANIIKVLAIQSSLAFIENRKMIYLTSVILLVFVGVWDKLNFLWILAALTISVVCVYYKETYRAIKINHPNALIIIGVSIFAGVLWFYFSILPIARQSTGGSIDLYAQFNRIRGLVPNTLDQGAYPLLMGSPWPGTRILSSIALGGTLVGLIAVPLGQACTIKTIANPDTIRFAKYATFFAIMNLVLFGCLVVTREAGGPHHAVVLSHIWQIQLICTGLFLLSLARHLPAIPAKVCQALLLGVVGFAALLNVYGLRHHWAAQNPTHAFSTRFTPAIVELGNVLQKQEPGPIISVDWGLHNAIFSLAPRGTRGRFRDGWPTFKDIGEGRASVSQGVHVVGEAPVVHLVYRSREQSVFPGTFDGLQKLFPNRPGCDDPPTQIRDNGGRVQFLILKRSRACLIRGEYP